MRVLVTGAAGYLGSVVVRDLLGQGHSVTALDKVARWPDSLALLSGRHDFVLVTGDVANPADVRRALGACDAAIHLAAIVGTPACDEQPAEATRTNIDGTRTVAALLRAVPWVYASTCSVYGEVPSGQCDEDHPAVPTTHYGRTKLAGEEYVRESGTGVVLRLGTAFGLSTSMRQDLLINRLVLDAVRTGRLEVFEPHSVRAFLHVRDISRALSFALRRWQQMAGGTYNVGDDRLVYQKADIAHEIARLTGAQVSLISDVADPDMRNYRTSFARISALGYSASTTLQQGVQELVEAAWVSRKSADEASA